MIFKILNKEKKTTTMTKFRIVYTTEDFKGWRFKHLIQSAESKEECERLFHECFANLENSKHAKLVRIEEIKEE